MNMMRMLCLSTMIATVTMFSGCTSIIRVKADKSDFFADDTKKQGCVDIYTTEQFTLHAETKNDFLFLKRWRFELGPGAIETFKYALAAKFQEVKVKIGSPSFPMTAATDSDLMLVIEPAFAGLRLHTPYVLTTETYVVNISFRVKVCDKTGTVILDQVYEGEGRQRGSVDESPFELTVLPEATRLAIEDALNKAVEDILSKMMK